MVGQCYTTKLYHQPQKLTYDANEYTDYGVVPQINLKRDPLHDPEIALLGIYLEAKGSISRGDIQMFTVAN